VWSTGSSKTLVVWCVESPCRDRPVPQQYHHNHQICADRVTCFRFSDRGASLALVGVGLSKSETRARKKPKDGSFCWTRLFFPPSFNGSEGSFGSFDLVRHHFARCDGEPITFSYLSRSLLFLVSEVRSIRQYTLSTVPPYHLCNVYLTSRTRSQQRTQSCTLDDQRPSPLARSTSVPSSPT
jgi:hypothetical protein